MKLKPIFAAFAVALAALVQPALASNYTFDENGDPTHYKGIPLPPIQTVEEARAATEKKIAAAKAEEARQAAAQAATSSNLQSEIGNHQLFFTGKPYLEETGQYLFLFRHYNPELARWTTADPSGFPDGANNIAYMAVPTTQFDFAGLASRTFVSQSDLITYEWEYGNFLRDQETNYYFQYRIRQVETAWEVVKQGAGSSAKGDPLTLGVNVVVTETWTNNLGGSVGFDGLGVKITVGYNRTWGGGQGSGYSVSSSKDGNPNHGWSGDILVAKASVQQEWRLFELVNNEYLPVSLEQNALGGGWRGHTVLGTGYNGGAGFAWYAVE